MSTEAKKRQAPEAHASVTHTQNGKTQTRTCDDDDAVSVQRHIHIVKF
jgi:hypothetical protein